MMIQPMLNGEQPKARRKVYKRGDGKSLIMLAGQLILTTVVMVIQLGFIAWLFAQCTG